MVVVASLLHSANGSGVGALTDGRTDGRYQAHYLSASLSCVVNKSGEFIAIHDFDWSIDSAAFNEWNRNED